MGNYVIATTKSWNIENYRKLKELYKEHNFCLVTEVKQLNFEYLSEFNPKFIFFPHWSWIIPEEIYHEFSCIVFHMTDLPFGRGGSPLQNLLLRGIYETKISAIRVDKGLDTGPVYWKEPLDIHTGSAEDIFRSASEIVFNKMIPRFIQEDVEPDEQKGRIVMFKRRTPEQSEIPSGLTSRQLYDYIRMLDGEGYPAAYQKTSVGKVYYRNARLENDVVYADAEFRRNAE